MAAARSRSPSLAKIRPMWLLTVSSEIDSVSAISTLDRPRPMAPRTSRSRAVRALIAVAARGVSLVFHKGSLLDDPAGLLEGEGRYLRQVTYERAAKDPEAVTELVRQAVARQTDMLD